MSKFRRFFKFIREFKANSDFPRIANYEITSQCNLGCEHCYCKKNQNSKDELSDDEWGKVFLEHKSRGATFAFLTGGEPTLRLNVIAIADRIFNGLSIASNGVIKIPDDIHRRIFISIDGPKDVHNSIRGAQVFDTVIGNIKNDKRVIIAPTLSMSNYLYIDDLIEIARETGVDGIAFSTYTSHKIEYDPLLLTGKELEWTISKLRKSWKKNKDIVFLTPFIINLLQEKEHHRNCFFKGRHFISFDSRLKQKKPCVLGEGVNCRTCGCIVPMISFALKKNDIRAWFMLNRMFPQKYFVMND